MADDRPNPEILLGIVNREESRSLQGKLRLFLGMCPGVGKTYEMLQAAHQEKSRGRRVIVGVVETHGRIETEALLAGLEILPRRSVVYKGTLLEEMDLDAILKVRPDLILVDEFAHTNAPGSRHAKRYQDVEELLSAGISVYTTLNIQHIESRNDQVAQITGVIVRETVPDAVIERADQIEIIDLPPAELLQRLQEGKVYLAERAERAKDGFFKEEHLTALRELALRFVAEKVDQDLSSQMMMKGIKGPWNTNERLLVAVSYSPYSPKLIRATRRMAYNLEAPWVALYVDTGEPLSHDDESTLQENLSLARKLGAEVITLADYNLVGAIQKICAERNVTQIVMGRPDRRFVRDLFTRGTLLDQLVRTTSNIDVHVIRAERRPRYRGFRLTWPQLHSSLQSYYNTCLLLIGISLLCYELIPYVGYRALGSIFLLSILLVSSFASRGPILFSAFVSAVVWNYFFIPPRFTFIINSWEDIMMVLSFFVTAIVGGLLTSRIRQQEKTLEGREHRTRLLYEFVQNLAEAKSLKVIQAVVAVTVDKQFGGQSTVFFVERDGKINWAKGHGPKRDEKELAVAQWAFENDKPAGWSTDTLAGAKCLCVPMRGNSGVVGILAFMPILNRRDFSVEKEDFLQAVLSQASIAFERLQFSEAAHNAKIYEASEILHQTLLNSVSHELRTPITALIGSATALKDAVTLADKQARESLTSELIQSAHRLDRVVENLLDLSRLQKGTLQLRREWFDVSDLISAIRMNLTVELGKRNLILTRDDSVLIDGDFQLLLHAVGQVVSNAAKYSGETTRIEVEIIRVSGFVKILIRDEGPGLPEGTEEQIFEKFYRLPGTPTGGLGLGLAIVESIVELHHGTVRAQNRDDRTGAVFEIRLPLHPTPEALQKVFDEK